MKKQIFNAVMALVVSLFCAYGNHATGQPVASFTISHTNIGDCSNDSIVFTNTSPVMANVVYEWRLPNGSITSFSGRDPGKVLFTTGGDIWGIVDNTIKMFAVDTTTGAVDSASVEIEVIDSTIGVISFDSHGLANIIGNHIDLCGPTYFFIDSVSHIHDIIPIWSTGDTAFHYYISSNGTYSYHIENAHAGYCAVPHSFVVTMRPFYDTFIGYTTPIGHDTIIANVVDIYPSITTVGCSRVTRADTVRHITKTARFINDQKHFATITNLCDATFVSDTDEVLIDTVMLGVFFDTTIHSYYYDSVALTVSGPTSVCVGQTIQLNSSLSGGTWISSNGTLASIGSLTGVVTGIVGGYHPNMTYTMSPSCKAIMTVTVNALSATTGSSSVCQGLTTTLTNPGSGGVWSSGSTAMATVGSSSGVVTGVNAGTTTISYRLATGCVALKTITVNPLAAITGSSNVCAGGTITLANAISGGIWTSSNRTLASVGSLTGVVTGVIAGYHPNMTYTLPTGCKAIATVNVINCGRYAGEESTSNLDAISITVAPNPNKGDFVISGSIGSEQVSIQLTNMLGQVVYTNSVTAVDGLLNTSVHLQESLANGMYILTVHSDGVNKVFHIVLGR